MHFKNNKYKSWVEVSKKALFHNIRVFRKSIGKNVKLAAVVKANAYGHDLEKIIPLLKNKIDVFTVDNIDEALIIRRIDSSVAVIILGYTTMANIRVTIENDISFTIYNLETLRQIVSLKLGRPAKIHLKVETGLNRQGVGGKDLLKILKFIKRHKDKFFLEGVSTHFANIEDTLDPTFAKKQLTEFKEALKIVRNEGFKPPYVHCAA